MLHALDLALLRLMRTRGHPPAVEAAVIALARCGEHAALWHGLAAAGALGSPSRRPLFLRALRAVLATQLANTLVKFAIRRARPALEDLPPLVPTVTELSYPSAHASTSFAAARVLGRALPAGPLYALAVLMALTRPYLGVHYPSDIVAGALFGDAMARVVP